MKIEFAEGFQKTTLRVEADPTIPAFDYFISGLIPFLTLAKGIKRNVDKSTICLTEKTFWSSN